uniref:ATP phosphoribosyltransferase n=1 Tax=Talaromyces marneffei PM1 TaxID=1077442 RepID=A0A093V517_TALMA
MSFGKEADEPKMSYQNDDEHPITSTDFGPARSEDARSTIAERDNDNNRDLLRAEIDPATPNVEGDIDHGSLDVEVLSLDGISATDRIRELDESDDNCYDADAGAARQDFAQDLPYVGTLFPNEDPHLDPILTIEVRGTSSGHK